MWSEEELKNMFAEISDKAGYQDDFFLLQCGYKNPIIQDDARRDLEILLEAYNAVSLPDAKVQMAYTIDEVITELTGGFTRPNQFIQEQKKKYVRNTGKA